MSEKLTDILRGSRQIAEFLDVRDTKVYRMIEKGVIPAGHIGGPKGMLIASKRCVAAALDKIASGEAP